MSVAMSEGSEWNKDSSEEEVLAKLVEVAVAVLQVPADKVTPEASLSEDLEADSLDLVEFVMGAEEEFGVSVAEDELQDVKTVQQVVDLIMAKLAEKP